MKKKLVLLLIAGFAITGCKFEKVKKILVGDTYFPDGITLYYFIDYETEAQKG